MVSLVKKAYGQALSEDTEMLPYLQEHEDVHAEVRRRLNEFIEEQFVFSVNDYGARGDGSSVDTWAFVRAISAASEAGGGVVLLPHPRVAYLIDEEITILPNVVVMGVGSGPTVYSRMPDATSACFRFQAGTCRARLENVKILGDDAGLVSSVAAAEYSTAEGIGISFAGSTFNKVRDVEVWDHKVGVELSDGATSYAGYNSLERFEINRSTVIGLKAHLHANANAVRDGRIFWTFDGSGTAVALSIDGANALEIRAVHLEAFDVGAKLAGAVIASITDSYIETGSNADPGADRRMVDATGVIWASSQIRWEGNYNSNVATVPLDAPPEEFLTFDTWDNAYHGGRHHWASAAHDNCCENPEFALFRASPLYIPGWYKIGTGPSTVVEETSDYETEGRSLRITQVGSNDGVSGAAYLPERCDYVTASVRYKSPLSTGSSNVFVSVTTPAAASNVIDTRGPADEWRWLSCTLKRDHSVASGLVSVNVVADMNEEGKEILLDRVIVTPGRVAPADRMFGQRVWMLENTQEVYTDTGTGNDTYTLDPSTFTGLAKAPRGATGMIVAFHYKPKKTGSEADGDVLSKGHYVYWNAESFAASTGDPLKFSAVTIGEWNSFQAHCRFNSSGTVAGGIIGYDTRDWDFQVDLLGWIMRH